MHTPGIKVAIPSTPSDAKGLLAAAIRSPDPVVLMEPKVLYRSPARTCPTASTSCRSARRASRARATTSLIAYGGMVAVAERAADELEASAEVVDVRTLKPLDEETLLASVAKTGRAVIVQEARRVAGFGAEIAALLAEKAILDLRGPVLRVTGYDVPFPFWSLEDEHIPSPARVVEAVHRSSAKVTRRAASRSSEWLQSIATRRPQSPTYLVGAGSSVLAWLAFRAPEAR